MSETVRHKPLPTRLERIRDEATRVLPAVVRVIAGMLWLANVDWKRPPDFRTFLRWVNEGVENPVLAPWSWALEHVVAPNIELFGWFTVAVELSLAVLLISGTLTRLAALAGMAQTTAIGLTVLNAPGEWSWSYYLMGTVHLAVFAMDAGKVWAVDALLRRARADDRPGVERGIRAGRVTVAAAMATVGVLIFATQVGDPFLNADYGGSTFPLIRGTMALGLLFLGFAMAVWHRRLWLLVGAALIAVAVADVSGLSKGEVERIWLPFAPWVILAGAGLGPGRGSHRAWLGANLATALSVQIVVATPW